MMLGILLFLLAMLFDISISLRRLNKSFVDFSKKA